MPFAAKMALPPALAMIAVVGLSVLGYATVLGQGNALAAVVRRDLRIAILLSQGVGDLQAVNGRIYRLLTWRAAMVAHPDMVIEIVGITTRIEAMRGRLATVETLLGSGAAATRIHAARDALSRYRNSMTIAGLTMDGDLAASLATVRPFEANAQRMIEALSQIAEDVTSDASRRAADAASAARAAGFEFLAIAVSVFVLVLASVAEITRRTVASVRRIARATRLVANGDETVRIDAMRRGDELGAIVASLHSFLETNARMNFLAHHDALTGLPNRELFHDRLVLALGVDRGARHCAVHCVNLDHFKEVNDTLGHPIGDLLLQAVAPRLLACVREGDTVARLGADEFAIIQLGVRQLAAAASLAQRVIEALGRPYEIRGHQIIVGASVGVAMTPGEDDTVEGLMRTADLALSSAKAAGRGTMRFYEPGTDAALQQRRLLEMDLRAALEGGQFEMYYQPLVNVASREVSGFEALIRWHHPTRGMVSPTDFIPLAEATGLIVPIGTWALRQACADATDWPGGLKVAVNLSPLQFKDGDLVAVVNRALSSAGLPPWRLELEITEGVMLEDNAATMAMLHRLRALGIRISMDDFGTGYSSLSYLRRFPFDKVKIDQSFIRDLASDSGNVAIVRAVTGLSDSLGMRSLAEGVETEEQLAQLAAEGCTEVQGYLFSPPCPAADVPRLVAEIASRPAAALIKVVREEE